MDIQKVVFMNKELGLRLAGLLRLPERFDLSKNYPAIVITGPMLSVKEQAQSVYAERLTEAGYVTLVFDGSYFGESEGLPRGQELPDVKESDIEGAVDYLCSLPYVDQTRIGGLGICGSGSYMSVAGVKEPRLKAITAIVPAISNIATCAKKDDMADILQKMIDADVIVLASPVYFYSIDAQMKALIDRTLARWTEVKNKEFYYIVTCADTDKAAQETTLACFRGYADCVEGAEEKGVIYGTGVYRPGEIKKSPAFKQAYEMGKSVR